MASGRTNLYERYELKEVLGKGGMGVVYRAVDRLMRREVAVKTILDVHDPAALDLFYREWSVLAGLVHPNIVAIYDIGEFQQDGEIKPFFVMPLLPGVSLDRLIRDGSPRLTVETVVGLLDQASRGLHAAHERGLVHRDIKPSNIFVLDDDSVKIIDFGIARVASPDSKTGIKGTLYYIAPEQLDFKPPTPLSDQYALAVVAYETFTRRRPFNGATDNEVLDAIRRLTPPPVSELNPNVGYAISQVIHKALARQPYHRFPSAKQFGESLQTALRNEPLDCFDAGKLKPRLERARLSFESGDYGFASEVLAEIEAEGHLDQGISLLRRQLDQAVRQTRIQCLLSSARRFFEACEYPLALRKIQEALELDPEHPDALTFREQVETRRRETKIEEWIQLARKHLDNQAFRQAREALGNVVTLKPNHTGALELLAEVGRREQDAVRVREEKHRLYQAAMQCWEKGEVTAAIGQLELLINLDRDLPEAGAGHSSTYQRFYNEVHSEHKAIQNAYEDARRNLAANDFEAALATCRQYLSKYPNHALFQALQFDVEERQRQELSAAIAETDRRVEEESDLDRRAAMLEEVLRLYPGEPHFEHALRLVRDKRDLVNSIVAKARFFEERAQFNEALDQWQILRSIHGQQPGLPFEIERLMKKRDQQARLGAKARWVEQTDRHLEAGDYDRAIGIIQGALAEFPDEPDLLELEKLVRKSQARGAEAQLLFARAREAAEAGALQESLALLRQAHQLDPRNSVIRTVLVNSLLENTRGQIAAENWEAAEAGLPELLSLDPQHAAARSLASRVADHKREEFISGCITQARRLQAEGDIGGALAAVAQGSQACPNEPRFEELRITLQRAQPPAPPPPGQPAEVVPPPVPPALPDAPHPRPKPKPLLLAAIGAGGVALIIFASLAVVRLASRPRPRPAPPATFGVSFQSSPPGAAITVNGQPCGNSTCDVQLPPGAYEAEAALPGYRSASARFTVIANTGGPGKVTLTLEPAAAQIAISTDLTDGTVTVDGSPAGTIQGGELEIASLAPGQHAIQIHSGSARGILRVDFGPGGPPSLAAPLEAQNLKVFGIAHHGPRARVYSSAEGVRAGVDGKPAAAIARDGLELDGLTPGPHQLLLQSVNGLPRKITFETGPRPALSIALFAERNVGSLRILTGEDGVEVYLNGQKHRRATRRGALLLFLPPKRYTVRVEKAGLWAPEQALEVRRGEDATLEFRLAPARSSLSVLNAPPGAEVWLDGARLGSVRPDGGFVAANLEPGKHTVALRKEGFQPLQADHVFAPGQTLGIAGALELLPGTLNIEVTPPGIQAQVRIRREGEAGDRPLTGGRATLPEGAYTVTATAPRRQNFSASVQVAAGRAATLHIAMKPLEPQAPPPRQPAAVFTLADWAKAGGWSREGELLVRRGGDFFLAPVKAGAGACLFTAILMRGRRLEWVFDYQDPKNYRLFQIDDRNFTRAQVVNGKAGQQFSVPHGVDRRQYVSVRVTFGPSQIVHSVIVNGEWKLLDSWQLPSGGGAQGRFGFRVPGRDQIGVSDFRFIPN